MIFYFILHLPRVHPTINQWGNTISRHGSVGRELHWPAFQAPVRLDRN